MQRDERAIGQLRLAATMRDGVSGLSRRLQIDELTVQMWLTGELKIPIFAMIEFERIIKAGPQQER
jgi:hypothetical protein